MTTALKTEIEKTRLETFCDGVIAIMWVNHHHMFLYLEKMDTRFLWLNIGLLFWMSMIPMPTALLGRNLGDPAATLIYGLVMTANTAWFMILRKNCREDKSVKQWIEISQVYD